MRNVFDQYKQPENQLTHALCCTLTEDRALLRPFLKTLGILAHPPVRILKVVQQAVPGTAPLASDEEESRGLPDLCIFDEAEFCVALECKVQASLQVGQLRRHRRTLQRHGYEVPRVIAVTAAAPTSGLEGEFATILWSDVYRQLLRSAAKSSWARRFVRYMEIFESKLSSQDYQFSGSLTVFDGLKFDNENPYTYQEAKRLIRLMGDELQSRKDLRRIGVDPNGSRRTAITGREAGGVWDYLPFRAAAGATQFTDFPHLTIGIREREAVAAVTIPNGVKVAGGWKSKLASLGLERFRTTLLEVESRLRPVITKSPGAQPQMYVHQRHYRSQRSKPITDGRLDADLRTLVHGKSGGVKFQPEWTEAIYSLLTKKRSNIQFGIDVRYSYDCEVVRSRKVLDLFAKTWLATKPLIDLALE